MNDITTKLNDRCQNFIAQVSGPFAKAFAVFIKELLNSGLWSDIGKKNVVTLNNIPWNSWLDLPEELRNEFEREIRQNNEMLKRGEIGSLELNDECIAISATANRLKQVLKEKGMSQKELANRLDVSPSFISKVLKNPDRSTVKTLRSIAKAIDVELNIFLK